MLLGHDAAVPPSEGAGRTALVPLHMPYPTFGLIKLELAYSE